MSERFDSGGLLAVVVALLLVASLLPVGLVGILAVASTPASATATTVTVDANHDLATADAVARYEESGNVSTAFDSPNLGVTIAEEASACGVEQSLFSDTRNDYLCFDHRQDTPTTLRIYIPDEYFHPFVRDDKQSIRQTATASFAPVENGSYTSVRVRFDEAEQAVFAIPEDVAASYAVIAAANNRSERWFGSELIGETTPWQYVNDSAWANSERTSVAIKAPPGETVLQYDAAPNSSQRQWTTVPESPDHPAPVYRMQREGQPNTIYVVAETDDPPELRYKRASGFMGDLDRAMRQIRNIPEQLDAWIDDILPPWLGGGSGSGGGGGG